MADSLPSLDVAVQTVSAAELKRRLDAGETVTILDTREPADVDAWRVTHPNAKVVNVPVSAFLTETGDPVETVPDAVPAGPLVTSCAKGRSSRFVAAFLQAAGRSVAALEDGMAGWAHLYESTELEFGGRVAVVQFHRPATGCLAYLLVAGADAIVIDPLRAFADRYEAEAHRRGAELRYAVDTHVHADHLSGVRAVATSTAAEPALPAGAVDRGLAFDTYLLDDGDTLGVGSAELEAVALPGHTTEMTGFSLAGVLFTGDSLFASGVARPDLEVGDTGAADAARRLYDTLQAMNSLPDSTRIAPGHTASGDRPAADGSYTAALGDIVGTLAVFSQDRETFVEASLDALPPQPTNYETIIAANLGRQSVDDEAAFELELGPNNCAVAA